MCIAPETIYVGPKGDKSPMETACHKCWQCRENAINDWVGRNIAETKTSKAATAVTLTYGRDQRGEVDNIKATLLTYSDVQKYLKLLRRHGFPVRYFVTGEFGSKKGRAHWHIMLYWQDGIPTQPSERSEKWFQGGKAWRNEPQSGRWVSKPWEAGHIPLDWNFDDEKHWPHGYSFWTAPKPQAVRYNCKYIQKGMGEADLERQGHLGMSKQPPLGALYFQRVAERHVQQGLAPQTLEYSFPDVKRRNRFGTHEVVKFRLRDRSADLYLGHFMAEWFNAHDNWRMPKSQLLSEWAFDWSEFGERDGRMAYLSRAEQKAELRAWREQYAGDPPPLDRPEKRFRWEMPGEAEYLEAFKREHGSGQFEQQEY